MLALAHYRSQRGSPDHTVKPGLYLGLTEAIFKDLNLTYSLISADFKAVPAIQSSSLTCLILAGCPSSANNSSRCWKGVEDREKSYCMGSKYRTQPGVDMSPDGDKATTSIAELGRASPGERACLCVMGINAGGLRGLK